MPSTLASVFLALLLSLPSVSGTSASIATTLAFTRVTVIDTSGTAHPPARPDMTVVISNGRIVAVGPSGKIKPPTDAVVIDAIGKYLIPGLWDMHIHLTMVPDQSVTQDVIAPELVAYGITSIRDMGGDWQRVQELRRAIAEDRSIGPRILSPGPFIDGPEPPTKYIISVHDADEARQAVRKLQTDGVDFIKVQAQLSLESWRAVLAESDRLGIQVAGHIPERISAFDVARSTQRSVEHISPVLPGDAGILLACSGKEAALRAEMLDIEHAADQPGADQKALTKRQYRLQSQMISSFDQRKCASLLALFAKNRVYAVPTQVFARRILALGPDDVPHDSAMRLVPRSMREDWEAQRRSQVNESRIHDFDLRKKMSDKSRSLVGAMNRAGMKLMAGTDAMIAYVLPGPALHQELEMMVESGLTPLEALQTATLNPAEFVGKAASMGTIEPGKTADLVLLDSNPLENIGNTQDIDAVVQGGRLLDRTALDQLLVKIESVAAVK